jgi:hypothetical protein
MKRDTLPCWPDEHSDYTVFSWRGLVVSKAVLSVPSKSQENEEVPENYLIVIVQSGLLSIVAVVLAEVEPHVEEDVARSEVLGHGTHGPPQRSRERAHLLHFGGG